MGVIFFLILFQFNHYLSLVFALSSPKWSALWCQVLSMRFYVSRLDISLVSVVCF